MKVGLNSKFILLFCFFSFLGKTAQPDFFYALDSNSSVRINQLENLNWKPYSSKNTISYGYNTNATVWCKLIADSATISKSSYWVFDNIHLDSIQVYDDKKTLAILGDRTEIPGPFFHLHALDLGHFRLSHGKLVLYASVKKQWTHLDFSMHLANGELLYQQSNYRLALTFCFLGFAALLLILTAYIYVRTARKWYLYYLLYSAMGILYVAVNLGILRSFFFPSFLYFSEVRIYSSCYWFVLLGFFLSETLNLKENQPRLNTLFYGFQFLVLACSIICLICLYCGLQKPLEYVTKAIYILFLLNIFILSAGIFLAITKRSRLGYYVLISFVPHILYGVSIVFVLFKWIYLSPQTDWINWIILYEMIFFGWLLIKDYVEAFQKNKRLQEQIIQDEKQSILAIEKARLKERRQVSELLHDKIGIDIARTIHSLEMGEGDVAKTYLFELGNDIRNLSHTILPKELEEGALWAALSSQLTIIRSQIKNIHLSISSYDFPPTIEKELAQSLYLIIMELLQNALKHAQAKHIRIECYGYPDMLVFTISDDGKGFLLSEKSGFGLQNIGRRIEEFGGNFDLTSTPNEGTTALLSIPR